jgi:hypothetical protein
MPPNEPFLLTAVRLRCGLNLKGHGGRRQVTDSVRPLHERVGSYVL